MTGTTPRGIPYSQPDDVYGAYPEVSRALADWIDARITNRGGDTMTGTLTTPRVDAGTPGAATTGLLVHSNAVLNRDVNVGAQLDVGGNTFVNGVLHVRGSELSVSGSTYLAGQFSVDRDDIQQYNQADFNPLDIIDVLFVDDVGGGIVRVKRLRAFVYALTSLPSEYMQQTTELLESMQARITDLETQLAGTADE